MRDLFFCVLLFLLFFSFRQVGPGAEKDTFYPVSKENVPQTIDELWNGYDPQAEPLEVEVLKTWEEDGVMLRIVRYRIGIFKGQKAMMAAIYGFPKDARRLPGLVQIHGGGQYADYRSVLTNAKRGYATISIAWAGRINAPHYKVDPAIVKLFWEGKTEDPHYKLTTDWGALDAYHAPCRHQENNFNNMHPAPWTIDTVESPRNNPWFLCTLGARRALTFLEQQPEVDSDKLGVYGHSMGGKITVLTVGSDPRVKVAAPSCGGISDRYSENDLYRSTIGDDQYLERITRPIIFLSPANDFHGRINDLQKAVTKIKSKDWRVACSPHHNHQDNPEYMVNSLLWLDQYLKGDFIYPGTPEIIPNIKSESGTPTLTISPDPSFPLSATDVYYSQQCRTGDKDSRMQNAINRFWHHAGVEEKNGSLVAKIPVMSTDSSLWVFANVSYPLDEAVTGAGYYYNIYTADSFYLSSLMKVVNSDQLTEAEVEPTLKPSLLIETFTDDWEKEWFTYNPDKWARRTHKLNSDQWKAPPHAKLSLEVRANRPHKMVMGIDKFGAEIELDGRSEWQQFILSPGDFHNAQQDVLSSWKNVMELRLGSEETLRENIDGASKELHLGEEWTGKKPDFKDLRWIIE